MPPQARRDFSALCCHFLIAPECRSGRTGQVQEIKAASVREKPAAEVRGGTHRSWWGRMCLRACGERDLLGEPQGCGSGGQGHSGTQGGCAGPVYPPRPCLAARAAESCKGQLGGIASARRNWSFKFSQQVEGRNQARDCGVIYKTQCHRNSLFCPTESPWLGGAAEVEASSWPGIAPEPAPPHRGDGERGVCQESALQGIPKTGQKRSWPTGSWAP